MSGATHGVVCTITLQPSNPNYSGAPWGAWVVAKACDLESNLWTDAVSVSVESTGHVGQFR